ncbi:unnamed protein product [Closterium sp. Yama58-4]|nr:unnamed protein product [Closterium sp. Yama58-4]
MGVTKRIPAKKGDLSKRGVTKGGLTKDGVTKRGVSSSDEEDEKDVGLDASIQALLQKRLEERGEMFMSMFQDDERGESANGSLQPAAMSANTAGQQTSRAASQAAAARAVDRNRSNGSTAAAEAQPSTDTACLLQLTSGGKGKRLADRVKVEQKERRSVGVNGSVLRSGSRDVKEEQQEEEGDEGEEEGDEEEEEEEEGEEEEEEGEEGEEGEEDDEDEEEEEELEEEGEHESGPEVVVFQEGSNLKKQATRVKLLLGGQISSRKERKLFLSSKVANIFRDPNAPVEEPEGRRRRGRGVKKEEEDLEEKEARLHMQEYIAIARETERLGVSTMEWNQRKQWETNHIVRHLGVKPPKRMSMNLAATEGYRSVQRKKRLRELEEFKLHIYHGIELVDSAHAESDPCRPDGSLPLSYNSFGFRLLRLAFPDFSSSRWSRAHSLRRRAFPISTSIAEEVEAVAEEVEAVAEEVEAVAEEVEGVAEVVEAVAEEVEVVAE